MRPERWQQIEDVFQQVLEGDVNEHREVLEAVRGEDTALYREVASLVEAYERAEGFMERAELEREDGRCDRWIGRRIGPYKILRELGRGGMSTVYLGARADREYESEVAVKIIRRGLDSSQLQGRFRRERQILADLDHPNIARLLDGGTTGDGIPYLVMERIEGIDLLDYCDEHRLSVTRRVELFRQVCDAVQFAHRSLIVHRDIKPANILVTASGVPKLLDFGIAKLIDPNSLARSRDTTVAWIRPMTPSYASPEQIRGRTVTTATDVYSLGVVLYRLLSGRSPYPLDDGAAGSVEDAVLRREPDPPSDAIQRPTAEVGGEETGLSAAAIGLRRGVSWRQLRRQLAGDLDNIVLTALAKDPRRRYGSVERLSEDLRRHLRGLPVTARHDTLGYRARKFVRRHRAAVASAAGAALLVLGFAMAMTLQAFEIARERDLVQRERAKAEQVSTFMTDLFKLADPERTLGATMPVEEVLARGAERIGTDLVDQPVVQAALFQAVGEIYHHLGLYDRAAPFLEKALGLRRRELGNSHLDVAESLSSLAHLWNQGEDFAAVEALQLEALDIRRNALGPEAPEVAESLELLSDILCRKGKYEEAEVAARRSLVIRRQAFGDDAMAVARSLATLAGVLARTRQDEEAEAGFRQALATGRRHLDPDDRFLRVARKNLAMILSNTDQLDEAERIYRDLLESERRVFGPEHPKIGFTLTGLGSVLRDQGDYAAAGSVLNDALALRRKLLGHDHPAVMVTLANLAELSAAQGDLETAERLYHEILASGREHLGADSAVVAFPLMGLGRVLVQRGEGREAETLLREALALRRQALPEGSVLIARTEGLLGRSLVALGEFAEAEQLLLGSLQKLKAREGPTSRDMRDTLLGLVHLYQALRRPEEAVRYRDLLSDSR